MGFAARKGGVLLAGTLTLFLIVQSAAVADIIHRKNGPPLEGKIIEETATKVVLKTAFGTTEIKKSDIVRIERVKTKQEQFEEKLKKLKFTDVDGLKKLAFWAEEKGLKREARKVYERILRLDPDDAFANRALGRVRYKGKWYTPKELKKVLRAEADGGPPARPSPKPGRKGHAGAGGAEHEGAKTRPSKPSVAAGDIAGLVEQKLGERPTVVTSEHFRIITMFEEEEAQALVELAEKIHEDFTEMIEEREGRRYWNLTADEFILSSRGMYVEFIDRIMPRYVNNKAALDYWKKEKGAAVSSFPPVGACVRGHRPLRNAVAHHCGHFLLRNYVGSRKQVAAWIVEGFAEYLEFKYEKACRVHCSTRKYYGGDTKLANKASDSSTWPELVKTSVIDGTDTPFEKLKHVMLNELDFEHLSKAWSLMTFLIDEHEEKFVKWMKNMRKMQWEEAMFKAYHWTNAELDKEWRLWVKAIY